jgi:predicted GNAT family N-acyltransferase
MELYINEIDTTNTAEYQQLLSFRNTWLREPLGLNLFEEDLSGDVKDLILVVMQGDEIVGCVMLQPKDEQTIKLRQMAIHQRLQGKGIGKVLVDDAEQLARERGYTRVELHARITAQGFYEKLGYAPFGEVFTEVTIPHIAMEKQLW